MSLVYCGKGIVIAGTGGTTGKAFRSTDWGASWDAGTTIDATDTEVNTLVFCGDKIVLAGTGDTNGHVYKSTDNGLSWKDIKILEAINDDVWSLAYLGNGIVLAGTGGSDAEVFKSTDYGDTWDMGDVLDAGESDAFAVVYLGEAQDEILKLYNSSAKVSKVDIELALEDDTVIAGAALITGVSVGSNVNDKATFSAELQFDKGYRRYSA